MFFIIWISGWVFFLLAALVYDGYNSEDNFYKPISKEIFMWGWTWPFTGLALVMIAVIVGIPLLAYGAGIKLRKMR